MNIRRKKAQNTAEYAILIGIIVAVAIAMQTYVKRSLQGGIKFAVDKVKSNQVNAVGQYEPYYLESAYDTTVSAYKDTEQTGVNGAVTRKFGADGQAKTVTRSGVQILKDTNQAN